MEQADEYADYEVQVVYFQITLLPVDPDGQASVDVDRVFEYEPVSDRGLDSDELAELVGWRRSFNIRTSGEADAEQEFNGNAFGEVGLGINLSIQEFAEQSNANNGGTRIDFDDSQIGVLAGSVNNYAEPGVLDSTTVQITSGFQATDVDNVGYAGGAGSGSQTTEDSMFYRDKLGSGPYVDRTDDITIHGEAAKQDIAGEVVLEGHYLLYWDVQEMPEGRASFARP